MGVRVLVFFGGGFMALRGVFGTVFPGGLFATRGLISCFLVGSERPRSPPKSTIPKAFTINATATTSIPQSTAIFILSDPPPILGFDPILRLLIFPNFSLFVGLSCSGVSALPVDEGFLSSTSPVWAAALTGAFLGLSTWTRAAVFSLILLFAFAADWGTAFLGMVPLALAGDFGRLAGLALLSVLGTTFSCWPFVSVSNSSRKRVSNNSPLLLKGESSSGGLLFFLSAIPSSPFVTGVSSKSINPSSLCEKWGRGYGLKFACLETQKNRMPSL